MSELHIVDLGVYITFQGVLIRLPLNCETQQGSEATNLQCMMLAYYELFVVVCSVCPVVCPPQTLIVKPRLQERLQWNSFMNHFASSAFELWLVP